jgi:hypothetical protein
MLLDDLLDGLVARLRTIGGLDAGKFPGHQPGPHRAVVDAASVAYDSTMARGSDEVAVSIMVYVPAGVDAEGTIEARQYMSGSGTKSLRAALERTTTGDGLAGVAFYDISAAIERQTEPDYLTVTLTATAVVPGSD